MNHRKKDILEKKLILGNLLAQRGKMWSFQNKLGIDYPDDYLIEQSLLYLELEEIPLLFEIYPPKKCKKLWREKLVPQREYYYIINFILATFIFNIKNPDSYFKRYE